MNENDPRWGTRDVSQTDTANEPPKSTTRRKIPCVNLGRVVNVTGPIVDSRSISGY